MFTPHLVVVRLANVKYVLVVRLRFRVRLQMYIVFTPHLVVVRLAYVKYVLVVRLRFRVRLQMYMVFTPHLVVVRLACVKYVWLCDYNSELDFRCIWCLHHCILLSFVWLM